MSASLINQSQKNIINLAPPSGKDIVMVIVRYSLVIILLIITFLYIYNPSIQFIMFIVLLILIIFGSTFIVRDISVTQRIFSETAPFMNIYSSNTAFSFLFLFAIGISVIFKIISITLFIVVLNYGRQQLADSKNSLDSTLNSDNSYTLTKYMQLVISSTILAGLLAAMVFILYATPPVRIAIANIAALFLSIAIIVLNTYEMIYASSFFDVFKKKGMVYQQNINNVDLNINNVK